jgi:RNA polymerase sigma-70 factor (ECF subfamily)
VGPDDAPDVVQDALLDAWRHISRLRDPAAFDLWLRSIVINRCRNLLRTRDRRVRTIDLRAAGTLTSDDTQGGGLRPELRDRLDRAFHRLSADHRAVLVLRYTRDYEPRRDGGGS